MSTARRLTSVFVIGLTGWLCDRDAEVHAAQARGDTLFVQLAQASFASEDWTPTSTQVREIQLLLKDLGFDPGAPDGVLGSRTTAALQAYQRSVDVKADGRLTRELYERLTGEIGRAAVEPAPSTPTAHVQPVQSADTEVLANRAQSRDSQAQATGVDCLSRSSGIWQFHDTQGSTFTLILKKDGTVEVPSYPEHWRWQSAEQGIEITYDNGMGLSVTRSGRLRDIDLMLGEAADSRGRKWTWTAKRLALLASDHGGSDCELTDTP